MPEVIKHNDGYGNILEDYSYFYVDGEIILEVVDMCQPPNIGESIKINKELFVVRSIIHDPSIRNTEFHLAR